MDQRPLVGRLLSPAGFGLVLLLFLLPFVTSSCQADQSTISATFTGLDMVTGGEPDFTATGLGQVGAIDQQANEQLQQAFADQYRPEPLAIIAAVALLAAMAGGLIRERLARHAIGIGLAVLAGALLVAAMIRATDRLEAVRTISLGQNRPALPPVVAVPRYGFWLALSLLVALVVWHGVALVRGWGVGDDVRPGPRPRDPTPGEAASPPPDSSSGFLPWTESEG